MAKKKSKFKNDVSSKAEQYSADTSSSNETDGFSLGGGDSSSEDGFSLGGSDDSDSGFSLSDNSEDSFSLSDSSAPVKKENKIVDESSDYSIPLPVSKVYDLLLQDKLVSSSIEDCFKRNLSVYRVIGLKPFQDPKDFEITRYSSWKEKWISDANNEWGSVDGDKVSLFTEAVDILGGIISNQRRYRNELKEPLESYIYSNLELLIKDKCSDKIVTSEEMRDLVVHARELGLCNNEEAHNKTFDFIKTSITKFGAVLKNFEDDFIDLVKIMDPKKRINTNENKQELLSEYKELKKNNDVITNNETTESDNQLIDRILSLLKANNLDLLSGIELFETDYFNKEIEALNLDLSLPLRNEFYYRLCEVARSYKVSEPEFEKFLISKNISKEPDVQIKLNFGRINDEPIQANSFQEICDIFMKYQDRAKRKIYEGDLENFLADIGRSDLEKKVKQITKDYNSDENAGLVKTCYTLLPMSPCDLGAGVVSNDLDELGTKIDKNFDYFSSNLVNQTNSNLQLWLEANDYPKYAEIIKNIISNKYNSYAKNKLNRIILCLHDNIFKYAGYSFYSPDDIVKLEDEGIRIKIIDYLQDVDSQAYVWIELKHEKILPNIKKWKQLNRLNSCTLNYALELDSPYHYEDKTFKTEEKLIDYLVENAADKNVIDSFLNNSENIEEYSFWAKEYQNSSLKNTLIKYLYNIQNINNNQNKESYSNVIMYLEEMLIENDFERYCDDLLPLFDSAHANDLITSKAYEKHIDAFFNVLNNQTKWYESCLYSYMSNAINKGDVGSIDKEYIEKLIKVYFNENVDRNYYENKIHPLMTTAIERNILSGTILQEEKKYFVEKYYQEFYNESDNEKRFNLLNSIESLEPNNKYVSLYVKSVENYTVNQQRENKLIKHKNLAKRNMIYFTIAIIISLGLGCFYIPALGIGDAAVAASLLILLFTGVIKSVFNKVITNNEQFIRYDILEQAVVLNFVAEQIKNKTETVYVPTPKHSVGCIILRVLSAIISIACCVFIAIVCGKFPAKFLYADFGLILSTFFTIKYYRTLKTK